MKARILTRLIGRVDAICRRSVVEGVTPSIAVCIGDADRILHQRVFGWRRLVPTRQEARLTTIYDLASLTKPLATGLVFCWMIEKEVCDLEAPLGQFMPPFSRGRRKAITLRHLLTHTSGLPPFKNYLERSEGRQNMSDKWGYVLQDIASAPLEALPGQRFIYSDLGYILLAHVIWQLTGQRLDRVARRLFYEPLELKDTRFLPPKKDWRRCAATTFRNGVVLQGQVHDPNAFFLGGVAGHAGLFSDLLGVSRICQMILRRGEWNGVRVLDPEVVRLLESDQSPCPAVKRGVGTDLDSPYSLQMRGRRFPVGTFGHTGYTGTSFLIDPFSGTFVVVLTNRIHPDDSRNIASLRIELMDAIADHIYSR